MALHITMEFPGRPEVIEAALEGLIRVNMELLLDRYYPPLYDTNVRYRLEAPGKDDWQTIDRLYESGEGDCEDVMGARVAQLRVAGEHAARARVVPVPGRDDAFHTFVERGNGEHEDPSKILIAKEQYTMADTKPTICVRDVGQHVLGVVELPLRDGRKVTTQTLGFDAWGAVAAALHELVNSPGVMAMISPQAAVAIQVAKRIADMNPDELKKLAADPKATDAQKALASKMLDSPSKGGNGKVASTAKSDWVIWRDPNATVGATKQINWTDFGKAPPRGWVTSPGEDDLQVIRTHSAGTPKTTPSRGTQATLTTVPGAPQGGTPVYASTPGGTTRVTDPGGMSQLPAQEAPLDPATNLYMAPDGSPFVWVPGTDANHPGHWVRSSGLPPQQQPGATPPGMMPPGYPPGMMPPGYPPGMMPPGYPPGMMPPVYPPGMMPPVYPGMMPPYMDPGAMAYGYPYPYATPYGYGGSPMQPYMPPGWWGGIDGMQQPQPLSLDEAAAVTVWGANSFAQGSFPGYI